MSGIGRSPVSGDRLQPIISAAGDDPEKFTTELQKGIISAEKAKADIKRSLTGLKCPKLRARKTLLMLNRKMG